MKNLRRIKLSQINPTKVIVERLMKKVPYLPRDMKIFEQEFYHPKINTNYKFPVKDEISEFRNKFNDNKEIKYLNDNYKELIHQLKKCDDLFEETKDFQHTKKSFELWESIINKEYNIIIENFDRKDDYDKIMDKISKMFNKVKPSNSNMIPSEDILKLHYDTFNDTANKSTFTVPINRYNLSLMIHPHWGFLCKFVSLIIFYSF